MSQENVEIVRRAYSAALAWPKPDFQTVNDLFDPNHEHVSGISQVEGRTYTGAPGFREWLTDMKETMGIYEGEMVQAEPIDAERVLGMLLTHVRSRRAEVPITQEVWFIATVRAGRVVRTESFGSEADAREAAGLRE